MTILKTSLAVLSLLIGVVILAIALLIVLFFTLIFPASQDGPVMWDRLGGYIICLVVPGILLIAVSMNYFRHRNFIENAGRDDYDDQFGLPRKSGQDEDSNL
jgi:hypothetical protein